MQTTTTPMGPRGQSVRCQTCKDTGQIRQPNGLFERCNCVIRRMALSSIGPFARAPQLARMSKLEGLSDRSLLIEGPWQVVAAHARKALYNVQLPRLFAASGRPQKAGLLRVGLTTDRELHAAVLDELEAWKRYDEYDPTDGCDLDQDDEDQTPEHAAESTHNHLCVIQIGLMPTRDELAAGAVAQAYLNRSSAWKRPTWIVTSRPYDKRHPTYQANLARVLGHLDTVKLTKEDL
jgi:hypothetical protein